MNHELTPFFEKINSFSKEFLFSLPNIAIAISIVILFYILSKVSKKLIKRTFKKKPHNLGLVLGRISQWAILLFGLFLGLLVLFPSFNVDDFIAGLGIGTIAIGFAFRDVFQNLLSGILILFNEPFKIGDAIKVESGQYEGIVEDIQTRATFIKTLEGKSIVIPNSKLYTDTVVVNTKHSIQRYHLNFLVDYQEDFSRIESFILKILKENPKIETKPEPKVYFDSFDNFSFNVLVHYWININNNSGIDVNSSIHAEIKQILDHNGINVGVVQKVFLVNKETL